jgi:hypothetical protein
MSGVVKRSNAQNVVQVPPALQDANAAAMCYTNNMASNSATGRKRRRTTMVPVTTMEEIPILSTEERAELTTALEAAQSRVNAGEGIDYDPNTFKQRLVDIYRRVKRRS